MRQSRESYIIFNSLQFQCCFRLKNMGFRDLHWLSALYIFLYVHLIHCIDIYILPLSPTETELVIIKLIVYLEMFYQIQYKLNFKQPEAFQCWYMYTFYPKNLNGVHIGSKWPYVTTFWNIYQELCYKLLRVCVTKPNQMQLHFHMDIRSLSLTQYKYIQTYTEVYVNWESNW